MPSNIANILVNVPVIPIKELQIVTETAIAKIGILNSKLLIAHSHIYKLGHHKKREK